MLAAALRFPPRRARRRRGTAAGRLGIDQEGQLVRAPDFRLGDRVERHGAGADAVWQPRGRGAHSYGGGPPIIDRAAAESGGRQPAEAATPARRRGAISQQVISCPHCPGTVRAGRRGAACAVRSWGMRGAPRPARLQGSELRPHANRSANQLPGTVGNPAGPDGIRERQRADGTGAGGTVGCC